MNEAHEVSARRSATMRSLANDLDSVGKLRSRRKRQVNEKLDVLLEAVAASGSPPSPAQVCPICVGRGVVSYPPNTPIDQPSFVSNSHGAMVVPVLQGNNACWGLSSTSTGHRLVIGRKISRTKTVGTPADARSCGKMFEGHKRRVICKLCAGAGSTRGAHRPPKKYGAILYEDADKQVPECSSVMEQKKPLVARSQILDGAGRVTCFAPSGAHRHGTGWRRS